MDQPTCPKCDSMIDGGDLYCPGSTDRQRCTHNLRHDHLFQRCQCGFETAIKRCRDAADEELK